MFIVEEGEKVCVAVQTTDDRLRRASLLRVFESTQYRWSFSRVRKALDEARTTFLGIEQDIPLTIYSQISENGVGRPQGFGSVTWVELWSSLRKCKVV
jgi:hypothetical protein